MSFGGGAKQACTINFGGSEAFLDYINFSVNGCAAAKLCKVFHLWDTDRRANLCALFITIHGNKFS